MMKDHQYHIRKVLLQAPQEDIMIDICIVSPTSVTCNKRESSLAIKGRPPICRKLSLANTLGMITHSIPERMDERDIDG